MEAGRFEAKVEDLLMELDSGEHRFDRGRGGHVASRDRIGGPSPMDPVVASGAREEEPSLPRLYAAIRDRIGKPHELMLLTAMGSVSESLGDWRRALGWFRTALALSEELRDLRSKADILYRIGLLRMKEGRWQEALQCFELCREIGERKVHDDRYTALAELGAGRVHTRRGDVERAREVLDRGLAIAERLDDRAMIAEFHQGLGVLHMRRGEYDEAITLFVNNLARFERGRDIRGMARALYDLGGVYRRMNALEPAVEYLERSMEAALELGDRHLVARNHRAKGELYLASGDLTLAVAYFEKAVRAFSRIGDELSIIACLESIGGILTRRGRTALARKYLRRAGDLARSRGDDEAAKGIESACRELEGTDGARHSMSNA